MQAGGRTPRPKSLDREDREVKDLSWHKICVAVADTEYKLFPTQLMSICGHLSIIWFCWFIYGQRQQFCVAIFLPQIRHVDEYPTMHYIGNPGHARWMIAYKISFRLSISGNSSWKLCCGNVVNMPYSCSFYIIPWTYADFLMVHSWAETSNHCWYQRRLCAH